MTALERTRRSLHGVAELVMAGPQYRASRTIRLAVQPGGFSTVAAPELRVAGSELVAGVRRIAMDGLTIGQLAEDAGVDVGAPEGLYPDGSGCTAESLIELDPDAVRTILSGYEIGKAALLVLASDVTPALWPEHFDLGIQRDEVNYGVSPGDAFLGEPYAYVGPWTTLQGEFWNAPFGAARAISDLGGEVAAFFLEGRRLAAS
jgi:hypothetical protein